MVTEDFEIYSKDGVVYIGVNLTRATILEANQLKAIIDEQIIIGVRYIVVDISSCEFIDSAFIGALVVELKRMNEKGGKLELIEPIMLDKNLFHITNTMRVFDTHKSREEAAEKIQKTKLAVVW